jgi:S1-C subfamily serine protease
MRFAPYAGIATALLFGILIAVLSGATFRSGITQVPSGASPAPSGLTPLTGPTIEFPATTTAPAAETGEPGLAASVAGASTGGTSPVTPPQPQKQVDLAPASAALRAALANIICIAPAGSGVRSISGSGVFVDSKGYILTNAHVAQYFLLGDKGVKCAVRTGSPAESAYVAALAYLPGAWISANADALKQEAPSGTGERDFAVLAVTGSATRDPLPDSFPSVPLAIRPAYAGTPVVIASYGAQFLETSQVEASLYPTIVTGSVKAVYTFVRNTIDVLGLGGSAAAQEGSSGGGVANADAELVGTITTSTVEGDTSTRSLNAITASYIRGEYASETGSPLEFLLAETPAQAVADFSAGAAALRADLESALSSR